MLLQHLPSNATVADIGSGGGLPIIPCLIARPDLEATLIESSQKKVVFLREALNRLGLRAVVLAQRFEDVSPPPVSFVTSRALDQFMQKLPTLMKWAPPGSKLMLLGGEALGEPLSKIGVSFEQLLIPQSEKRYLFLTTD
jgi:16S rRNA (guanine527-N7)-methyltransferase